MLGAGVTDSAMHCNRTDLPAAQDDYRRSADSLKPRTDAEAPLTAIREIPCMTAIRIDRADVSNSGSAVGMSPAN